MKIDVTSNKIGYLYLFLSRVLSLCVREVRGHVCIQTSVKTEPNVVAMLLNQQVSLICVLGCLPELNADITLLLDRLDYGQNLHFPK